VWSPLSWVRLIKKKYPKDLFPPLPDEGIMLDELEEHYIREAYKKTGGNEKKAAKLLGLSYYAFRYKRKKMN